MKKTMFAALLATVFAACNSDSTSTEAGDTTSGDKVSAVENVNGNIPETTNTINLGGDKDTAATGGAQ